MYAHTDEFSVEFAHVPDLEDDLRKRLTTREKKLRDEALQAFEAYAPNNRDRELFQVLYRPVKHYDGFKSADRWALIDAARKFTRENGLKEKGFVAAELGILTGVLVLYASTKDHAIWSYPFTADEFVRDGEIASVKMSRPAREFLLFFLEPE